MKQFFLSGLLTLGLAACAGSPMIDALYDKDADFSKYKTYDFTETRSEATAKYSTLLDKFMKSAISTELLKRGYKQSDEPDLMVNFHISSKEKTDVYDVPRPPSYYFYRNAFGYHAWPYYTTETRVRQYTEGTVTIDLVDAGEKQLVWEGTAVGQVKNEPLENLESRVNEVVKQIFVKYPFKAGQGEPVTLDQ